jgi:hypothetical protein
VFETTLGGTASCATRSADVTGDNEVDVTDLTRIVNHIIGQQILSPAAQLCADVSDDGSIDIVDVVQTVRVILGERPLPQDGSDLAALTWSRSWSSGTLHLSLQSNDLAAFQVEVDLAPGIHLSGAPRVEGMSASDLVWNESGSRLVILAPPEMGLSARPEAIDLEIDLLSTDSGEGSDPVPVRLLGVGTDGMPLPAFEGEPTEVDGALAILSLGPNPSPGSIELRYRSTAATAARATIHDASGRRIHTLEGNGGPGEHTLSWNGRDDSGRNVSSGIYFVRIQAEGMMSSRSFRILR